jgi:plastocyanin
LEEEQGETQAGAEKQSDEGLSVSPALVNMLIGQTQGFSAFDEAGHNVTSKAEWTVSDSSVADLSAPGASTITSKSAGTVRIRASLGGRSGEARIIVHPGDKLPIGTVLWQAPKAPGNMKTQQTVIAVPSGGR